MRFEAARAQASKAISDAEALALAAAAMHAVPVELVVLKRALNAGSAS